MGYNKNNKLRMFINEFNPNVVTNNNLVVIKWNMDFSFKINLGSNITIDKCFFGVC